jgi:hypothetical protein
MARSNTITAANITNQSTPRGTTAAIQNSYVAGKFRTFNTDTDDATANQQCKPAVKIDIN